MMANVEEVEVVVAYNERATLRVGDVFLKIDANQMRTDVEVEAMAMAPIPTPEILWRKPGTDACAAIACAQSRRYNAYIYQCLSRHCGPRVMARGRLALP